MTGLDGDGILWDFAPYWVEVAAAEAGHTGPHMLRLNGNSLYGAQRGADCLSVFRRSRKSTLFK